jgi:hypothetical protein
MALSQVLQQPLLPLLLYGLLLHRFVHPPPSLPQRGCTTSLKEEARVGDDVSLVVGRNCSGFASRVRLGRIRLFPAVSTANLELQIPTITPIPRRSSTIFNGIQSFVPMTFGPWSRTRL